MPSRFSVIIAGGGPSGLTAALAFSKANIDFTLLEKYATVMPEAGSDLVLAPYGTRVLSQLGLYDDLVKVTTKLGTLHRVLHDGSRLGDSDLFKVLREK